MSEWATFYAIGALLVLGLGASIAWLKRSAPKRSARVIVGLLSCGLLLWLLWLAIILVLPEPWYD